MSVGSEGSSSSLPVAKEAPSPLVTEGGTTTIAAPVVAKIAGIATREIVGVHAMGSGASRAMGAIRERLPGGGSATSTQGVRVEVGERQAAVDLDLVVDYGIPIVDLANSVRDNVISRIERLTGLEVTEVNVSIDDVHLEEDEDDAPGGERVR